MSEFDRQKWDAKYAGGEAPREPSAVLVQLANLLPSSGRALDVAGGGGRNAIWLAQQGLDVTLADVSANGLAIARQRAAEAAVRLATLEIDLEATPVDSLPAALGGPWDVVLSLCYLWRPIYAVYPRILAPGGMLVVIQPTKRNLERHEKPPAGFLLDPGELPTLVPALKIVHYQEAWSADDRHDAVLVARNSPGGVSFGSCC